MLHRKVLQKIILFLCIGSLNGAMAGSVREWDAFDGVAPEGAIPMQRGFGEEEIQAPEDAPLLEAEEIAMPKRRNGVKPSHKAFAMVPLRSGSVKGIKDETGI